MLHERFELRQGVTVGDAADILWTLTAPELPVRLVQRRGWSPEKFEALFAGTMAEALLPPAGGAIRPRKSVGEGRHPG
jgi:hypothetical protein